MSTLFCCIFNTTAGPARAAVGVRLRVAGLVLASLPVTPGAFAAPPMYLCPGNLFSNHLEPAQARAMGCQIATAGRLSQAHDPQTALANTASPASPANTETTEGQVTALSAPQVANTTLAPPPARKTPPPVADAAQQRARDSDAKEILRSELARTQAQLQALMEQAPSGPETDSAVQRLRADEAALRRELARLPS